MDISDEAFLDGLLRNNPGLTAEEALAYLDEVGYRLDLTGTKYEAVMRTGEPQ